MQCPPPQSVRASPPSRHAKSHSDQRWLSPPTRLPLHAAPSPASHPPPHPHPQSAQPLGSTLLHPPLPPFPHLSPATAGNSPLDRPAVRPVRKAAPRPCAGTPAADGAPQQIHR